MSPAPPRLRPPSLLPLLLLPAALLLVCLRGAALDGAVRGPSDWHAALRHGYPPSAAAVRLMNALATGDTAIVNRALWRGYAYVPSYYRRFLGDAHEAATWGRREQAASCQLLADRLLDAYTRRHGQGTLTRMRDNFLGLSPTDRTRWLRLDRMLAVADSCAERNLWATCDSLGRVAAVGLSELGDDYGAGRAWTRAADALANRGFPERGAAEAERALPLLERCEAPFEVGRTAHNLASTYEALGRYDRAEATLARAYAVLDRIPGPMRGFIETDARSLEARLRLDRGRFPEAIQMYEAARDYSRRFARPSGQAEDLRRLAGANAYLGQLDLALARVDSAVVLARADNNAKMVGDCLTDRGGLLLQLGRPVEADSAFAQAAALFGRLGDPMALAGALSGEGNVRGVSGDFVAGRRCLEQALLLARRHGDARHTADYLIGLGRLSLECAEYRVAHGFFGDALAHATAIGLPDQRLEALLELGRVERQLDRPDAAEKRYAEALELARATGRRGPEIAARLRQADIFLARGEPAAAETAADEAGAQARACGALGFELEGMALVARARLAAGRLAAAEDVLAAARHHPGLPAYPLVAFDLEWSAARLARRAGHPPEAARAFAEATMRLDEVTDRAQVTELRAGLLTGRYEVYREAVAERLEAGDPAAAFELADRSRGRSLVERLAGPVGGAAGAADTTGESVRREIATLTGRLEAEERGRGTAAVMDALRDRIVAARRALEQRLAWGGGTSRDGAAFPRPARDTSCLPRLRAGLARDVAFVEFFEGERGWQAFVARADTLRVVGLPGLERGDPLFSRVNAFRHALERDYLSPGGGADWATAGAALYRDAWYPLRDALGGTTMAILAPEGALRTLPWAALVTEPARDGGRPKLLMESVVTTRAPSAAALLLARRRAEGRARRAGGWLGVAATPPGRPPEHSSVEREVQESAAALHWPDSHLLLGSRATETNFMREAVEADWIHLACHAHFLREAPRQSWLQLARTRTDDGHLEVEEIERLGLRARLVTLSACETGLEGGPGADREPTGEELVGMVRAFLAAGADAVIASLWPVPDDTVAPLMSGFCAELAREPDQPARAFNRAAVGLLASAGPGGRSGHPYLVAAFCLTGLAD